MSERVPARASGARSRGTPRGLLVLGWIGTATLVALSKFAPSRRPAPLGPPSGHLAEGLPPLPESAPAASVAPSPPTASAGANASTTPASAARPPAAATPPLVPSSAPPTLPRALARPLRLLAEAESTLTEDRTPEPTSVHDWRRELPRPFAALRRTASPLIMPRLTLPRVLAPDFVALRGLAARARPGQAVHVKLTAYCLNGRTRQGTLTRAGVVAADTRIFPLARHVHLFAAGRYLGRFRVEDTGSGVRGPHIDIWTPDCADARRFGTRAGVASLAGFGED